MPEINFFWDPLSDNILQERDETGAVTAEYTAEPGLYGNIISQNRGGVESQFHYDAQGSTLAVTDDNQNITDTFAYTAFGEVTERTGTTEVPFQYIGHKGYYTDNLTGQLMVRERPYEPARARWMSADPLGPAVVGNLFVYVVNCPSSLSDASGLQVLEDRDVWDEPTPPYHLVHLALNWAGPYPVIRKDTLCGQATFIWELRHFPPGVYRLHHSYREVVFYCIEDCRFDPAYCTETTWTAARDVYDERIQIGAPPRLPARWPTITISLPSEGSRSCSSSGFHQEIIDIIGDPAFDIGPPRKVGGLGAVGLRVDWDCCGVEGQLVRHFSYTDPRFQHR